MLCQDVGGNSRVDEDRKDLRLEVRFGESVHKRELVTSQALRVVILLRRLRFDERDLHDLISIAKAVRLESSSLQPPVPRRRAGSDSNPLSGSERAVDRGACDPSPPSTLEPPASASRDSAPHRSAGAT